MSPIVHIHGLSKCESHLLLNNNANDIPKIQLLFDHFHTCYKRACQDHATQFHYLCMTLL